MLLNNFIATMYRSMKTTDTIGRIKEETAFDASWISSLPSNSYSETTSETSFFAPFARGIAFGSGTTPPRKQIIN